MKILLMIGGALALAACANLGQTFAAWEGRHVDTLVAAWGPPAATHRMDDGQRILSYTAQQHYQVQGPGIEVPFSGTYWCEVTYWVDPGGMITSSRLNGNLGGCNTLLRRKGLPPQ
ncbi:hypothetical protein [Amphritea sp. HPY]|uniref:hypothetical protein n=1 Tax=Amphritea sp. HPY TaxID=3421652 RepID=UPI003D7CDE05